MRRFQPAASSLCGQTENARLFRLIACKIIIGVSERIVNVFLPSAAKTALPLICRLWRGQLFITWKGVTCYAFCYKSLAQAGFPCARAPYLPLTRLLRKSEPPRAILLRKQRRREKPNAEPTANVGFLFPSRDYHTAALAKKISKKDFLRRGAASVLSVVFGCAEPPAVRAPPRRCQFKKKFANPLSYSYTTAGTDCRNRA